MLAIRHEPEILKADVQTTTPETTRNPMLAAPAPPPELWGPYLRQKLDPKMYEILCANKVPYFVLKSLADDDWDEIHTLLTRWHDIATLYSDDKDTLGIASMPAKEKEKIRARMAASLEDLRHYKDRKREEIGRPANRQVIDTDDRRAVENAFTAVTGDTPRLENQGSPNMLGKLMTAAAEGRINALEIKDLVPYHPAPWVRLEEVWEMGPDGKMALTEKKTRPPPATSSSWKDMMRLWYTTLMMAVSANSHQPSLRADKEWWRKLQRFYEEFLFGEAVLKRPRPPPLHQIMVAERKAWQRIASLMWTERRTLQQALEEVWKDHLWWQSLLEANGPAYTPQHPGKGYTDTKGRAKGQTRGARGAQRGATAYSAPTGVYQQGRGKGGKGKKGGAKGGRNDLHARQTRGATSHHPPSSAHGAPPAPSSAKGSGRVEPRIPIRDWPPLQSGAARCRDFHIRGTCPRGTACQFSHNCPGCGKGDHPLTQCRNI